MSEAKQTPEEWDYGCPTCSHTLHGLGYDLYHCPRCGTLVGRYAGGAVTVPALVVRCQQFEKDAPSRFGNAWTGDYWKRLGIAESINRPGDRP